MRINIYKIALSYPLLIREEIKTLETVLILERHIIFRTVYQLIKLTLLLPMTAKTVEMAFSMTKISKNEWRNKMPAMTFLMT